MGLRKKRGVTARAVGTFCAAKKRRERVEIKGRRKESGGGRKKERFVGRD